MSGRPWMNLMRSPYRGVVRGRSLRPCWTTCEERSGQLWEEAWVSEVIFGRKISRGTDASEDGWHTLLATAIEEKNALTLIYFNYVICS
jgi:hypothetical protein